MKQKTIEDLAHESGVFMCMEEYEKHIVMMLMRKTQKFLPITEKPEEHELVIAKYAEDCYAIARYENGSFLTAYPVHTQPLEYRPLEYK